MGNCVEEVPKATVGKLSADRLPTIYRQATDKLQTVSCNKKFSVEQTGNEYFTDQQNGFRSSKTIIVSNGDRHKLTDRWSVQKMLIMKYSLNQICYCITNGQKCLQFKRHKQISSESDSDENNNNNNTFLYKLPYTCNANIQTLT